VKKRGKSRERERERGGETGRRVREREGGKERRNIGHSRIVFPENKFFISFNKHR